MRNTFLKSGDKGQRSDLLRRFKLIDDSGKVIPCGTWPDDILWLAHALLVLDVPGDVVECGCYAGGSAAKLSIVAAIKGKELHIYDSFAGLPKTATDEPDVYPTVNKQVVWAPGRFAATKDGVAANIKRFGEIGVCTFHEGWFADALPGTLPDNIAYAFVDVDLASSARTCIAAIWPRLVYGGLYFTHEAAFVRALYAMHDASVWREMNEIPPPMFGTGRGLGDTAAHLGLMVKGVTDADYITKVLLRK